MKTTQQTKKQQRRPEELSLSHSLAEHTHHSPLTACAALSLFTLTPTFSLITRSLSLTHTLTHPLFTLTHSPALTHSSLSLSSPHSLSLTAVLCLSLPLPPSLIALISLAHLHCHSLLAHYNSPTLPLSHSLPHSPRLFEIAFLNNSTRLLDSAAWCVHTCYFFRTAFLFFLVSSLSPPECAHVGKPCTLAFRSTLILPLSILSPSAESSSPIGSE